MKKHLLLITTLSLSLTVASTHADDRNKPGAPKPAQATTPAQTPTVETTPDGGVLVTIPALPQVGGPVTGVPGTPGIPPVPPAPVIPAPPTNEQDKDQDQDNGDQDHQHGGKTDLKNDVQEFQEVYYSPQYVHVQIQNDMRINCKHGLCSIASVTTRGEAFTVETSAGYGPSNNAVSGGGSSGVVIVNPSTAAMNTNQPYVGLTIRYTTGRCTQTVGIPRSLYIAMNTYLYSLMNEDGSTRRTFDPAQQTMILFYTTIMKQATGCQIPAR